MSHDGHQAGSHIRAKLSHPVIDADGHWLEFGPLIREEMKRIGGDTALQGYMMLPQLVEDHLTMSVAERRERGVAQAGVLGAANQEHPRPSNGDFTSAVI